MFSQDRDSLRRVYLEAWRKFQQQLPLEPVETQVVEVIQQHPEYQPLLDKGEAVLDRDWSPEQVETNPFLHMALHLAIREQVQTDQPPGIRQGFERLLKRLDDRLEAEHQVMECLAEAIWRVQRDQTPFEAAPYLDCIKRR